MKTNLPASIRGQTSLGGYNVNKSGHIYPCTVIRSRYQGTYSGGFFVAIPVEFCEIPEEATGSDIPCGTFWGNYEGPKGTGGSPGVAYENLIEEIWKQDTETRIRFYHHTENWRNSGEITREKARKLIDKYNGTYSNRADAITNRRSFDLDNGERVSLTSRKRFINE